ncbi:MAG: methylmalonyl-CoA epimerase [Candidatus Tectomicrobia bacterium]|uniref:Methylmalonyl-CoA epimerase n=1 Tax=Tectimicrobiota bacterium TaxID=2528274 RepID=A0A932GQA0_UNCTE|nr:methylmalonyl-CoA epimerase [Candidatus Tectomicrobia bacterium]
MAGSEGIGIKRLHHIGIVVRDLEEAIGRYQARLGLSLSHVEELPGAGVRIAYFPLGGTRLELIQPLDPNSGVARFLSKRGEGMHHLAYAVEDLGRSLDLCRRQEMELIDQVPRPGGEGASVAFLHPRSTGGVLTELIEEKGL